MFSSAVKYNVFTEMVLMVIYVDVLIVLNILVDYFLLKLTARIVRKNPRLIRLILGSASGGISSLYIFLPPQNFIVETLVRIAVSLVITLITFGFGSLKTLLKNAAVFFAVTFGFAGAMLGLWYIFEPEGMAINNSVVYFNISPVILIILSAVFYVIVSVLRFLLQKNSPDAKECKIKVTLDKESAETTALIDTGNSITDTIGMSEVIIVDKNFAQKLFGNKSGNEMTARYRVIPCNTVSGTTLLEGYRCDKAYIKCDGNTTEINRPILAVSKTPLDKERQAIINPRSV